MLQARIIVSITFLYFTHTATTEIYTLSLHDALPISYINAMWIMFPNSTLQKHGTGRSGGPGRDRCDENQPAFIWVAVGIRNPGDCCFDSGPCSAESRLRLETIHRVAATSVTRPTRHFLRRSGKARLCV